MVFSLNLSFELNDIDYEWAIGYIHGLTDASANPQLYGTLRLNFS